MMKQPERNWRKFQKLRMRGGVFSARARKAEAATVRHARQFIVERWRNAREVRRNIGLWLLGVGVLIAAVVVQFGLLRGVYTDQAPVGGGTYAEGVIGTVDTLNPLYATTAAEQSAGRLLFSSLFAYDDTGALQGDIATRYTVDESGKVYTVGLRDGVYWHDGKPLTVDDIIFTVGLLKKPATGSALTASWQDVAVKKINDTTLEFTLPAAYTPFVHALTFAILPQHLLKDVAPNMIREHPFSQNPVGSGPMALRFLQRVKDNTSGHVVVHMTRNNSYHKGAPKLSRMQLHAYENREGLATGLRSKSINAASGDSLSSLAAFKDDDRFNVQVAPTQAGVFALFNTKSNLLKEKPLRQALQRGTDVKKALQELPWHPRSIDSPFTDRQVERTEREAKPSYNEAEAKKILDEAGWKMNDKGVRSKEDQPLQVRIAYVKDTDYEVVVANLAKQWRKLGVEVVTRPVDVNDPVQNFASSVLQPRDYEVLVHELTIGADPDIYAYWHSSQAVTRGLNFANFHDDISDDALSSARTHRDPAVRNLKYQSFIRRWHAEAPAIGLYQSSAVYVSTKATRALSKDATLVSATDRYANIQNWTARFDTVYKTP